MSESLYVCLASYKSNFINQSIFVILLIHYLEVLLACLGMLDHVHLKCQYEFAPINSQQTTYKKNYASANLSLNFIPKLTEILTHSWQRSLSYRNQYIDLQSKLMDWFIYDRDLRDERVNDSSLWRSLSISRHAYPQSLKMFGLTRGLRGYCPKSTS